MILFILNREGLNEMQNFIASNKPILWVNAGVLSAQEISKYRQSGVELTNFTRPINLQNASEVEDAIQDIRLHYPNHSIWVQYASVP